MSKQIITIQEDRTLNEANCLSLIEESIQSNKDIVIIIYSFSNTIEEVIKHTLKCILEANHKPLILNTIYNVIFESILNGLKANAKKLFFKENNLDINNPEEYSKGLSLFKSKINKNNLRSYGERNKEKGVYVQIQFLYNHKGLEIEIINNTALLPAEETRIREKLALGDKYDNLMSYYMDNSDSTEGEGLGLVLSLILLKAEKLDPSLYRIGTKNGLTFARIEIPFDPSFISKRHHTIT